MGRSFVGILILQAWNHRTSCLSNTRMSSFCSLAWLFTRGKAHDLCQCQVDLQDKNNPFFGPTNGIPGIKRLRLVYRWCYLPKKTWPSMTSISLLVGPITQRDWATDPGQLAQAFSTWLDHRKHGEIAPPRMFSAWFFHRVPCLHRDRKDGCSAR